MYICSFYEQNRLLYCVCFCEDIVHSVIVGADDEDETAVFIAHICDDAGTVLSAKAAVYVD